MTEELKTCPFCGSSDIDPKGVGSFKPEYRGQKDFTWENYEPDMVEHSPACNECGATAGDSDWNARADDAKLNLAVEALERFRNMLSFYEIDNLDELKMPYNFVRHLEGITEGATETLKQIKGE